MTTTYIKVNKASSTSYTKTSGGFINFNDALITFNSSSAVFDGNKADYTKVNKASGTTYIKVTKAT